MYQGERLDPKILQQRVHSGRGVIRETSEVCGDRTIFAYAALWPTLQEQWWEIGTFWVFESERGNGLASTILGELLSRAPHDANFFLITKESRLMQIITRHGFKPIPDVSAYDVTNWATRIGLGKRLPEHEEDRRLFMR